MFLHMSTKYNTHTHTHTQLLVQTVLHCHNNCQNTHSQSQQANKPDQYTPYNQCWEDETGTIQHRGG